MTTPLQPTPDPLKEPATKGADGGASITGEAHMPRDPDDDSVNGSQNLEQRHAPDKFKDGDPANHGSR
ncbi:hypothetical protein [Sphingomonas prati]|uniref:Uncharacterized protein n=1 Tax=Sphingomonas prati TaxID=1843237 RepID=A0A7W9BTX1_9SPHN|nr:hypothetical protein [Sphingomonas prati]MBB5730049.1 hypothetical protein [Sphingomonas prati]GGE91065.1 hypothetical protein GCM10011404_25000 [Sphingomonas prati]